MSRTGSAIDILLFLIQCVLWIIGGWGIVAHIFRLPSRERLVVGIAAGWLLFISMSNLLAHFLPLTPAFWLASLAVLLGGLFATWRSPLRPRVDWRDVKAWPVLLSLAVLTNFFYIILRGLAIFDDYVHLPLVSTMAAGDIPPHFYADPAYLFAYHYGLHIPGSLPAPLPSP